MTWSIWPGSARTAPSAGTGHHYQIDIFANHAGKHLEVLGDDLVQVEHLGGQHLLAAKGQQLAGQGTGAFGCIGDFLRRAAQARIGSEALEQKLRVARDHHQKIIEVMRDAAGKAADGFHFLRLTELQLQRAGFGNVFHKYLEAASFFSVRNRAAGDAGTIAEPSLRTHSVVRLLNSSRE